MLLMKSDIKHAMHMTHRLPTEQWKLYEITLSIMPFPFNT